MILDRNREMFVMPDPGEIQLEAFYRPINRGSMEESNDFPRIEDTDQGIGFRLFGRQYYVIEPLIEKRDAVYESVTYSSELYVPARLTRKGKARMGKQTVYIGSIPLMSSRGTFVVNGIDRVIINQILRSPGIYYNLERDSNGNPIYTGTIISNRGGKLKLELDGRNRIWVRVRKKRKISIQLLLLAMGIGAKEVSGNVCYPDAFQKTKEKNVWSREHAVLEFCKLLYGTDEYPVEFSDIFEELRERFFQPRFEIGEIGRINLNKKLDLDVPKNEIFLLPKDMLAATDYLIGIGIGIGTLDDIDHLKNRRIRTAADLLQDQLRLALERLADSMRGGLNRATRHKHVPTIRSVVNSSLLLTTLKEFFGSHPLSQSLDQTNPLTQTVHKRKLSSLGPRGLTRRTASSQVRDIHPSHYGRVCPIETSEGMNAGLISSLALHAGVNHWGYLTSPFHRISRILSEEDVAAYVSAEEDEGFRITTGTCLSVYRRDDRGKQATVARYRQEFVTFAWNQIHLRSISPSQYFSVGASLIPFLENNDANRTLMGSNMQRQAVPLLRPERCIVGTGLEGQIALDSGDIAIAPRGGRIDYIDGEGATLVVSDGEAMDIELVTYQRSNNNTCMHQKPGGIDQGEVPRKGQVMADCGATKGGELALGRNILTAYMPWEGYNFEDSVLISERLIFEDIYTSIHIDKYEVEARATLQGTAEIITRKIPHLDDYFLRHLDESGLVLPGSWVETGDVLVGKLTPRNPEESLKAPESNSLQAIFGIDTTTARETCLKVPTGGRGRIIDVRWIYPEDTSRYTRVVHVYVLQKREMQVGDKAAGRHGNKGITPKITPRQDMPHSQDGTSIDTIPSPSGVPSRMNVGQIFERVPGPAGYPPERHYRIRPLDERHEREAPRKLVSPELYGASEQTANPRSLELDNPGKSRSIDGRTGEVFEQPATVGKAHMPKLIHQVDDKIHARSSGPHSRVTQQPLKGRSKQGGQRVGEMEVRAPEGSGVSHIPQEMPTIKPDHVQARRKVVSAIVAGEPVYEPETTTPESPRSPVREPRRLAPDPDLAAVEKNPVSNNRSWKG
uniref:DNA-directed RNA polymerase subunit beta n=1 Tax=Selaginella nummulariifolia TaxID=1715387 RepID=A0A650FH13_9TRAC|nr:RNA polymerase beta subunit [Selaginella nummulariifolia]